jgi:hypothetical protein
LLDYGSRRYDPELGRFIQPDSIVPTSTQGVQAWDRYAYANNSPVVHNDPSGHCIDGISTALCIAVLAGGIVGGIASGAGYVAAQKATGQEINYQDLGVAVLGGVAVGALSPIIAVLAPTAGAAIAGTLALNGVVAGVQYAEGQALHGEQIEATDAVAQFGIGVISGAIGGTYTPFDELGREGMSQGLKLGMDFGKQTLTQFEKENAQAFIEHTVIQTVLVNGARTFAGNAVQPAIRRMWDSDVHGNAAIAY